VTDLRKPEAVLGDFKVSAAPAFGTEAVAPDLGPGMGRVRDERLTASAEAATTAHTLPEPGTSEGERHAEEDLDESLRLAQGRLASSAESELPVTLRDPLAIIQIAGLNR
jgi:hypothetical protein